MEASYCAQNAAEAKLASTTRFASRANAPGKAFNYRALAHPIARLNFVHATY
jgi:hypothetical protein